MRRGTALSMVVAAAAIVASGLIVSDAGADDAKVTVRVRNGSTGTAAPAGLPVDVIVMTDPHEPVRFTGVTGADGAAVISVPVTRPSEHTVVGIASARYGRYPFHGEPFHLTGDPGAQPTAEVAVIVYDVPGDGLPRWSYAALAVIFLTAFVLTACRRSDRQLPD